MAWTPGCLGVNPAAEVRARFVPVVERLAAGGAGDVVVVSHGAAIRLVAAALLGDTAETFYVPNAGLVVLRPNLVGPEPAGWTLESWDRGEPLRGDVTAGGPPVSG